MQWIRGLFGRANRRPTQAVFDANLAPEAPFVAVADIHGRLDLLDDALTRIEAAGHSGPVVFVGDYIDRGPDSAGVLRRLFELQSLDPGRVICLAGNHEDMMLGFLDDPERYQRLWLRNGGAETLLSFGLDAPQTETDILGTRDQLLKALGPELHVWLRDLPVSWRSGNVWVTHAGADPAVDLGRQDRHALIWGHPEFRKRARDDGQWVLHGHTIVPEVKVEDGRISIDTGAYMSDELSVVRVDQNGVTLQP